MSEINSEDLSNVSDGDFIPESEEEITQDPEPINPEEAEESDV